MVWARAFQQAEDNAELAESVPRARGNTVPHGAPYEQGQPGGGCGPQCISVCTHVCMCRLGYLHMCIMYTCTDSDKSIRYGAKNEIDTSYRVFRRNVYRLMCVLEGVCMWGVQ